LRKYLFVIDGPHAPHAAIAAFHAARAET
jgi:hypothetical protein